MQAAVPFGGRDQAHTAAVLTRGVNGFDDTGVDATHPNAVDGDRFSPGDRAEDRELGCGIRATQVVRRVALGESFPLCVVHGIGEGALLLESAEDVGRGAVQHAADGVDLFARERLAQGAYDRHRGRDGAFAVEARVRDGQAREEAGIPRQCLLVRGHDGGAAVECGADPWCRLRCSAGVDDEVDRGVDGYARGVAGERGWREPRVAQVRTEHSYSGDAEPCARDLLERAATLGERCGERGPDGSAADETKTQYDG